MSRGSAGAGSEQSSVSYTPEQRQWLGQALELYGPMMGAGQAAYAGERVAPFTQQQQQVLDMAPGYLNAFAPGQDMPLYGETGTALGGILSGQTGAQPITPQATQEYWSRAIEQPARYEYATNIAPGISEQWAGPGYWGGERAKAQQRGSQEFGKWLGTQKAGLEWQVGETNRALAEARAGRALSAVGPALQYGAAPTQQAQEQLAGTSDVFGLLSTEQQQRQAEIDEQFTAFLEQQRLTDPESMRYMLALLGMRYTESSGEQWGAAPWTRMIPTFSF